MSKHKVKAHFSHGGKTYKPGDDFESNDPHEIQSLAQQGHIEHPQGQPQGQQGPQGQAGAVGASKGQGSQQQPAGSSSAPQTPKQDDPSKQR